MDEQHEPTNEKDPVAETTDTAAVADGDAAAGEVQAGADEPVAASPAAEVEVDPAVGDLIDPPALAEDGEDDVLDEAPVVADEGDEDVESPDETPAGVEVDPAIGDLVDPPTADEDADAPEDVEAEPLDAVAEPEDGSEDVDAEAVGEPARPDVDSQLKAIIEALVFASPDPLTVKSIAKVLDGETPDAIEAAIEALKHDYAHAGGLQMVEVASGYQIVTRPDLHEWVRRLFHERTTQKLSVAALETLAVIAYKQPITAAEIAEVRGVNTSGVLGTLIDRKLVKITGRKQVVGRPFMYATTREFLNRFGLRDLNDLPKVEDMADALGFEPPLLEDAATTAALPFDMDPSSISDAAADVPPAAGDPDPEAEGPAGS